MSFVSHRPNSWVSQQPDASTQLTYALQVNPSPLTVSTKDNKVTGTLEFFITNPNESDAIPISSVVFTIRVGTTSACLTNATDNIQTSVSNTYWSFLPGATDTSLGTADFTLTPAASAVSLAAGDSIVVQIYNFTTVSTVGTTEISIAETIGTDDPTNTAFDVTTFPSGFTFRDLTATVLNGSNKTPVAQVANGTPVTLTWNSSVAVSDSFQIYYSTPSGQAGPITPTEINTWTSPPLSSDTVFTLVLTQSDQKGTALVGSLSTAVSVVALPAQSLSGANMTCPAGKYQAGTLSVDGGTILSLGFWANSHWFYPTQMYVVSDSSAFYAVVNTGTSDVTWNPVLLVAPIEGKTPTVDVSGIAADPGEDNGGITVTGDLTVSGSTNAQVITATGLTVSGSTNAQAITATGLTVSGSTDAQSITSTGLTVSGAISSDTLSVTGSATLSNVKITGLSLYGSASLFSNAQGLNPSEDGNWNHFKAPTDGFVIGVIVAPDNSTPGCMCWADAQTNGIIWRITGGNVGFFGKGWNYCMASNPNSLTMPVQVGADFSICVWQGSGDNQQANASTYWYWIPIGVGQAQSVPEAIAEPGPNFISVPPPTITVKQERNADDFIGALEELTGKTIDDQLKNKLLSAL